MLRLKLTHVVATIPFAVCVASATLSFAQQAGFLDLTTVTPRLELRRPAPEPGEDFNQKGGIHGGGVGGCSPQASNPAFRTTIVSLDRTDYTVGDSVRFEVRIENVGSIPIQIPFSPHLGDLQPSDPAQMFEYVALSLELRVSAHTDSMSWTGPSGAWINLYGREDHPQTMLTLNPGRWVEIVGKGTFHSVAHDNLPAPVSEINAEASISRDAMLLTASKIASLSHAVCIVQRQGPPLAMTLSEAK